jgi:endoglucanase
MIMIRKNCNFFNSCLTGLLLSIGFSGYTQENLSLNEQEYFETPGLNVFVFADTYTEGHQGGIQIIQNGNRVATNGDLWLEPAPGQWSPFSKLNTKRTDAVKGSIEVDLSYPNSDAAQRNFNPIVYPDLKINYTIRVLAEGKSFHIIVDLEKSLPKEYIGKVGFNLELFPGNLFGATFDMDGKSGSFPRQLNGPFIQAGENSFESMPMAEGHNLTIAPESEKYRINVSSENNILQLIDGRTHHNNGWFILRSQIEKGASAKAVEWLVTPNVITDWYYKPVIHINQVGYLPNQEKKALIECDKRDSLRSEANVYKVMSGGEKKKVYSQIAEKWGDHLRYSYYQFDFSSVSESGTYFIEIDTIRSEIFRIGAEIYDRNVWQPVLEYFLPVQMCHMRVNDRYRVWHGLCHMDDALMAPCNTLHFDGYAQGPSTLTTFKPGEHVPGLNQGGWHDAGDFDLRVESQAETVYSLCLIYDSFREKYDITTINQQEHLVEMHRPDGIPDILQQIEHGVLSITGGYKSMGRLFRGIISNDLRQYVILGDPANMTNNIIFEPAGRNDMPSWFVNTPDDRWVFIQDNDGHSMQVCKTLAIASRVLKNSNDSLSALCLEIALELWNNRKVDVNPKQMEALVELILTTNEQQYLDQLSLWSNEITKYIKEVGWTVSRVAARIDNSSFMHGYMLALQKYYIELKQETLLNPFGVPYNYGTWGLAWNTERFGLMQYFLYKNLHNPESKQYLLNSLNYVLGVHAGENTSSFVSGVGSRSAVVAYGLNRDDWSYIPGGVISGTSIIKPDFPELKEWPYLWQQTEYMISGAAENFIFLVLGAKEVL